MKKILIGICGIGNGHINRQSCIIKELLKDNHEIMVVTTEDKIDILRERFPSLKISKINIPWIICNNDGINYIETFEKYKSNNVDLFSSFLNFCIEVENYFEGKPDLIISDYEPNVAQYSYSCNVPFITMEQQSKFLYLDELKIDNFSIKEEQIRLNYFFPVYSEKIISSFFPIDIKEKNVTVIPPIISKIEKQNTDENFVLIYFSPYSDSEKYKRIIDIIKDIKNLTFKVYTRNYENYIKLYKYEHIEFINFNNNFKYDLTKCSALITTGGHQLISEAISLDIPLYVIPLNTYEQNYNALMVEKYKLGMINNIEYDSFIHFFNNRPEFKKNIIKFKEKYYKVSWENKVKEIIDKILNNKYLL